MHSNEPLHLPPEIEPRDYDAEDRLASEAADALNDEEWLRENASRVCTDMQTVDGMLRQLEQYGVAARAIGLCLYTRGRADSMREAVERAAGVAV